MGNNINANLILKSNCVTLRSSKINKTNFSFLILINFVYFQMPTILVDICSPIIIITTFFSFFIRNAIYNYFYLVLIIFSSFY